MRDHTCSGLTYIWHVFAGVHTRLSYLDMVEAIDRANAARDALLARWFGPIDPRTDAAAVKRALLRTTDARSGYRGEGK